MKTLEELRPLRTRSWNQLEESSLFGQLTLEKCKIVGAPTKHSSGHDRRESHSSRPRDSSPEDRQAEQARSPRIEITLITACL